MQQNIVSGPNAKSKCREKKHYILICENKMQQSLRFTETCKLRIFYQKNFILQMKGIAGLATSNNLNEDSHESKCPKTDRSIVKTRRSFMKLSMPIPTHSRFFKIDFICKICRRTTQKLVFFPPKTSFLLLLDTIET